MVLSVELEDVDISLLIQSRNDDDLGSPTKVKENRYRSRTSERGEKMMVTSDSCTEVKLGVFVPHAAATDDDLRIRAPKQIDVFCATRSSNRR